MAEHLDAATQPVYAAAELFRAQGLQIDGSIFTPGRPVWSDAVIADLYRRFVEEPDESSDSFLVKFERQLAGADDTTIQLAAELLFVHFLFPADITGDTKRVTIDTVRGWAGAPVAILPDLSVALDRGLARTGVAYKTYRPNQLSLLLDFIRAWKSLSSSDRDDLLSDPWQFKAMVFEIPLKAAHTQREALLHLVHPDTFENTVSREYKRKIVAAFGDRVPAGVEDIDRALLAIRTSLAAERGEQFDFYAPGVVETWQPPPPAEVGEEAVVERLWILRPNIDRVNRLAEWLREGFCAVGWSEMGPVAAGTERREIMAAAERAYPDQTSSAIRAAAGNVDRFVNQLDVGNVILVPDGSSIYVGAVETEADWLEDVQARRRGVEWLNPDRPIQRASLSDAAASSLRTQLTVTDATEHLAEILTLVELPPERVVDTEVADAELPPATETLAADLLLPLEWLDRTIELLREKRQVIFYGPPGTGKTYVAQELADHLTSEGGNSQLIQFHPSYAYEDFFEGFRPRQGIADSGQLSFELVPGPLRRIAQEAADDRSQPYVLVIDEINRGNVAKIFGELYFLLEYRDRSIQLQYSPNDEFRLPPNLYVIGTMNAADRSIALVDAAMRRRFYFVEFFPRRAPISGLLRRWLEQRELPASAADVLDAINERIEDEDFGIGPSYLMSDRADDPQWIEQVWEHSIIPLLTEHYFGTGIDVSERFGLAGLRRTLEPLADAAADGDADSGPTESQQAPSGESAE